LNVAVGPVGSTTSAVDLGTNGPNGVNIAAAILVPLFLVLIIGGVIIGIFVVKKKRPEVYFAGKMKVKGVVDSVKSKFGK
jgi:hypothetical protein